MDGRRSNESGLLKHIMVVIICFDFRKYIYTRRADGRCRCRPRVLDDVNTKIKLQLRNIGRSTVTYHANKCD